jgi:hypothetical protein
MVVSAAGAILVGTLLFVAGRASTGDVSPSLATPVREHTPQARPALESEIAAVDSEIKDAMAEDAQVEGGLVKALIRGRLAVLQQTRAMLNQKKGAWFFGIMTHYRVDGHAFVPDPDAQQKLAGVARELEDLRSRITAQRAEAAESGGLVGALNHVTLATMRQTEAMLDQKRVALEFGLPNYLGDRVRTSEPAAPSGPPSVGTAMQTPQPAGSQSELKIVSIDSRVTESNESWSKYAWKLIVQNSGARDEAVDATIEFQDRDGFIIDSDNAYNLVIKAGEQQTFTGYALIRAAVAGNVASVAAKIRRRR